METERKAVLFDLDGTLWDSSKEVLFCWNRVLTPLNRAITPQELSCLMGLTPREIGDAQFPDLPPAERYALMEQCLSAEEPYLFWRGARLYPNVRESLKQLKKHYCIGLVSNCTEGYAQSFFHAHALSSLFDDHETAGRTGLGKGENIRLLLQRNEIHKAVYIGDTAKDLAAAKAANIPFIFASWGFGKLGEAQPCADSFSELLPLVFSMMEG